jgi:short-subunit dehydrogenase
MITGGSAGLGFLYVKELIQYGYNVIVVSPHEGQKSELIAFAKKHNSKIIFLKYDLCSIQNCKKAYEECIKYNVVLVINNSGIGA